jgi:hypothetical protein
MVSVADPLGCNLGFPDLKNSRNIASFCMYFAFLMSKIMKIHQVEGAHSMRGCGSSGIFIYSSLISAVTENLSLD